MPLDKWIDGHELLPQSVPLDKLQGLLIYRPLTSRPPRPGKEDPPEPGFPVIPPVPYFDVRLLADATIEAAKLATGAVDLGSTTVIGQLLTNRLSAGATLIADALIAGLSATKVTAGTFVGGVVYAGEIVTNQLVAGTALIGNALIADLAATKILAGTLAAGVIYAGEVATDKLVAGTALIGDALIGEVKTNKLTAGSVLIGSALISDLAATKITAGTINVAIELTAATVTGGVLRTAASGTRIEITSSFNNEIQLYRGAETSGYTGRLMVYGDYLHLHTARRTIDDSATGMFLYGTDDTAGTAAGRAVWTVGCSLAGADTSIDFRMSGDADLHPTLRMSRGTIGVVLKSLSGIDGYLQIRNYADTALGDLNLDDLIADDVAYYTLTSRSSASIKNSIVDCDINAVDIVVSTPLREYEYNDKPGRKFLGWVYEESPDEIKRPGKVTITEHPSAKGGKPAISRKESFDSIDLHRVVAVQWKALQELALKVENLEKASGH